MRRGLMPEESLDLNNKVVEIWIEGCSVEGLRLVELRQPPPPAEALIGKMLWLLLPEQEASETLMAWSLKQEVKSRMVG